MSVFLRMYRGETKFDFVELSKRTLMVSLTLVVLSLLIMVIRPFNLSIDFTGGVIVTVENRANASVVDIRADLREIGSADARVQITGDGFITVQTEALGAEEMDILVVTVADTAGVTIDDANVSAVGPTFGAEVTRRAIQALVVFLFVVSLFITWRFEWKMAVAALTALLHDLIITAGLYALVGFTVTPATIIAVLTILGYSLYDTVVVLDKVMENVADMHERSTYSGIVNQSMNQVLMRSINTSMTSLLPVGSLLLVGVLAIGAETLQQFALALFIGMTIGTYSSIFVAAPILARWKGTEPEWRRQIRRSGRTGGELAATPKVEQEKAPFVPPPPTAAARPPKQRRKRR
ncbi:MAG: protein translocase subunit SecF [Actinomycetota bacterium]|nr:protein translocase subunit SecF [Actinomycetota bacterium]MDK1016755.1 protein translocase subunit SecF [Actinomycetota bacterium]MDK1026409.1 protein translocase subunit SecF [Actinomycetota bacterium]MDK1037571.1 protein translocase subunit SecF [Actinomycetota bacterium]MDK1097395.1 protein translocase subunit SecF [Actinomycetota bacterium]